MWGKHSFREMSELRPVYALSVCLRGACGTRHDATFTHYDCGCEPP